MNVPPKKPEAWASAQVDTARTLPGDPDPLTVPTVPTASTAHLEGVEGAEIVHLPSLPTASTASTVHLAEVVEEVREWISRFIVVLHERDVDLLTLWAAHTHAIGKIYTTPRLALTSPLPGAGKTTVLEHLHRLCLRPVQVASLTSSAMLARLIEHEPATLLLDEVDRNLDPSRPGVADLLACINTGYKRGGSRPVLVADGKNGWIAREMPTFSPIAMAGISPRLPDDTRSRMLTVTLLPDSEGLAEDTDWEEHEEEALELGARLAAAVAMTELPKPPLPPSLRGRGKERWNPLWRLAHAIGGDWPDRCSALIKREQELAQLEKEEGLVQRIPSVSMLAQISKLWPGGAKYQTATELTDLLTIAHADEWGPSDKYPKGLTVQRLGRMLAGFDLRSSRSSDGSRIGYAHGDIVRICTRVGLMPVPLNETVEAVGSDGSDELSPLPVPTNQTVEAVEAVETDDLGLFPATPETHERNAS